MTLIDHGLHDGAPVQAPVRRRRFRPTAVRAYDIRGVVGRDFDETDARALGLSYATVARTWGMRTVAVGRDGRLTSPAIEAALVEGLVEGGMRVSRIGVGPTPKLTFAVRRLGLHGGIQVTASHNPPNENGFKLLLGPGRVHGSNLQALVATEGRAARGGSVRDVSVEAAYVERLSADASGLKPFKVAWDAGSGATGDAIRALVRRLPGRHVLLNTEIDGRFPCHHPDPAVGANLAQLQAAVRANGCDLGLAFDGDGDRLGAVDGEGEIVWADQLLLFLAADLLTEHPGATVVADVKCSRVVAEGVARLGGRAVTAPSGYVRVCETMEREHALLGGELSGHIFFADRWDGADDALYAAVRVLLALSRGSGTLADFRKSLPATVATPEARLACADARKAEVVRAVASRVAEAGQFADTVDGLRVSGSDGWWLLRASATEPKLTVRCEGSDEAAVARLKAEVAGHLRACGIEPRGL
jgi:phosphomannomutase